MLFHNPRKKDKLINLRMNQKPLTDYLDHSKLLEIIEKAEREGNRTFLLYFNTRDRSNIFHFVRSVDEFERIVRVIDDKEQVKKLLIKPNSSLFSPIEWALANGKDELFIHFCKFFEDDLETLKSAILPTHKSTSLLVKALKISKIQIYDYLFKLFERDREFIEKNLLIQDDLGKSIIFHLILNKYHDSLIYLFDYLEKSEINRVFEIFSMKDSWNHNQLHLILSMGNDNYELIEKAIKLLASKIRISYYIFYAK